MVAKVLVVSETFDHHHPTYEVFETPEFDTLSVESGEEALDLLCSPAATSFDVALIDSLLTDLDGLTLLERLQAVRHGPPIVFAMRRYSSDIALTAMRLGAFDVLSDPSDLVQLTLALRNAARARQMSRQIESGGTPTIGAQDLVSVSQAMDVVRERCRFASKSFVPVLIEGEPGTGKRLVAQRIHQSGARRAKGLVFADSEMSLAELKDCFAGARGGTVYLNRADQLDYSSQSWLTEYLTTTASGKRPAGSRDPRLILSSRERLVDRTIKGHFGDKLYNLVSACPIWLPPLRDRTEDIEPLAHHLLPRFAAEIGVSAGSRLRPDVINLLKAFPWPGNIRQFKILLFRAMSLAGSSDLTLADFPSILAAYDPEGARARLLDWPLPAEKTNSADMPGNTNDTYLTQLETVANLRHEATKSTLDELSSSQDLKLPSYGVAMLIGETGELRQICRLEEDAIRFAFDHCDGRISEMARRLGLGRSTLYRKLREYQILPEEQSAA